MRRKQVEITLFIPVYVVLLLETLVLFAWLGLVHKGFTLNEEAKLLGTILGLITVGSGLGAGIGAWAAGLFFDLTGSYQMAFLNGIGVCIALRDEAER